MTYHKQLYRHQIEKGILGDCYRTCIANLLGLQPWEVPHFMTGLNPGEDSMKWVEDRGLKNFYFEQHGSTINQALDSLSGLAPGEVFMLTGLSNNEVNHCVLVKDGVIVHDPSLDNSGIIGPCKNEDYFLGHYILKEQTIQMKDLLEDIENGSL